MHIAVLGAGAWGTALAITLSAHHRVSLWARDAAQAERMASTRRNERYLPVAPLPDSLMISADIHECVARAELLFLATPIAGIREAMARLHTTSAHAPLLWLCKGLEPDSGRLPHQIIADCGGWPAAQGVLSGPSFADEVAQGLPTAVTLASTDAGFARRTAAALNGARLRIYANNDLVGAEVGGAVKNVLAIAAGLSDGLGYGYNARAALITRGLAEISRLGVALGGRGETFVGLGGVGALTLACAGVLSPNRRVGLALAQGLSLADATRRLGHVAEGVGSAAGVERLAQKLAVDMPIAAAVHNILQDQLTPQQAVAQLLLRDPKEE